MDGLLVAVGIADEDGFELCVGGAGELDCCCGSLVGDSEVEALVV